MQLSRESFVSEVNCFPAFSANLVQINCRLFCSDTRKLKMIQSVQKLKWLKSPNDDNDDEEDDDITMI